VLSDNDFGKLGFYSLGLLYFVNGISALLVLPLVNKFGSRKATLIGAFCLTNYVASFILPAFRS